MMETKSSIFILCLWISLIQDKGVSPCAMSLSVTPTSPEEKQYVNITCTLTDCSDVSTIIWEKCSSWDNPECQDVGVYEVDNNRFVPDSGYSLQGRSEGYHLLPVQTVLLSFLNIHDVVAEDDGKWKCKHAGFSEEKELQVQVPPGEIHILRPVGSELISNRSIQVEVRLDRVNPLANLKFQINGTEYDNSTSKTTREGPVYVIIEELQIPFYTLGDTKFQVVVYKQDGTVWDSSPEIIYTIIASPRVEYPTSNATEEPRIDDESFTLSCTASGHERTIKWVKDSGDVGDLFDTPITSDVFDGNFPYGQPSALRSSITWNQPVATCNDVVKHNGEYWCEAKVDVNGMLAIEVSSKYTVNVLFGPISNMSSEIKVDKFPAFNLTCDVCANPLPYKYDWEYNGKPLPDDVKDFKNGVIQIDTSDCRQCGVYTCIATNNISALSFQLQVDPKIMGLSISEIIGICIGVLVFCGIIGFLLFMFIWKKNQNKADEEVVAYAESGHRTDPTINGTANTQNTNVVPVYSDVIKKKTGANAEEQVGPVYSQVTKPGRSLPQLKPKPNNTSTAPVYSEVNKTKKGRLTPIENQSRGGSGGGGEYEAVGGRPLPPIKNTGLYDNAGQRNEQGGLHYADVDFLRQGNGTKQSHGTKNPSYEPTEYAQIDHRKSAGIVV